MQYKIANIDLFRSMTSWMCLQHPWDGGELVELTGDEFDLLVYSLDLTWGLKEEDDTFAIFLEEIDEMIASQEKYRSCPKMRDHIPEPIDWDDLDSLLDF
jgi:hypothetical protein